MRRKKEHQGIKGKHYGEQREVQKNAEWESEGWLDGAGGTLAAAQRQQALKPGEIPE